MREQTLGQALKDSTVCIDRDPITSRQYEALTARPLTYRRTGNTKMRQTRQEIQNLSRRLAIEKSELNQVNSRDQ